MNQNPYYAVPDKQIRFSRIEIQHLSLAVLALTIAFSFVLHTRNNGAQDQILAMPPLVLWIGSFAAVSSGFVLHELAHKLVAQHYGHWAEFRAQFGGLGMTLVIAIFMKVLFAAPGAVMIHGRVTPKENGLISIAGPATNFVIASIAFPFTFTANEAGYQFIIADTVAFINAMLCVFNLLPIGPLDGRKVWYWSKLWYFVALALGIALLVIVWTRPWGSL